MDNENNEQVLQRELAKLQSENAELRAQLDEQRSGFDVKAALDRIDKRNQSDAAYRAEMEDALKDTGIKPTKYI